MSVGEKNSLYTTTQHYPPMSTMFKLFATLALFGSASAGFNTPTAADLWDQSDTDHKNDCGVNKARHSDSVCCGEDESKLLQRKTHSDLGDSTNCNTPVFIYCLINSTAAFQSDFTAYENTGDPWSENTVFGNAYATYHAFGSNGHSGAASDPNSKFVMEFYKNSYAAFNGWVGVKMNFGTTYTMGGWDSSLLMISAVGICDEVMNFGDSTNNPFKAFELTTGLVVAGGYVI